jgi:hypothetical protein
MGLFSSFLISGVFDQWERGGIDYIAVANADDVLFRLDPGAIGHLANRPDADAVVVTMPWAYSASIRHDEFEVAVRADESGWSMDEKGHPLAEEIPISLRRYDSGGAVTVRDGRLSIDEGTRPNGALFNTNQLYLRLSAIRRVLDDLGTADRLEAVRRIIAELPTSVEDKTVVVDGRPRAVRQLNQPLHGILRLMSRCDVRMGSRSVAGIRGGYAPLKHASDLRFTQLELDRLHASGDELSPSMSR